MPPIVASTAAKALSRSVEEKPWRAVVGKCLAELLGGPCRGRMGGEGYMHQATSVQRASSLRVIICTEALAALLQCTALQASVAEWPMAHAATANLATVIL
jgi:hypothetical protein